MADTISLAVWDVPMPVVAGERFAIKVGAKVARLGPGRGQRCGRRGGGVGNARRNAVARHRGAALGGARCAGAAEGHGGANTRCDAARPRRGSASSAAAKPDCTLAVQVTEQETKAALDGVEIRLGPFHARTDKAGRAELRVCKGEHQLQLWRTAHISRSREPIKIEGDTSIALTMVHVPEDHPDARWVR